MQSRRGRALGSLLQDTRSLRILTQHQHQHQRQPAFSFFPTHNMLPQQSPRNGQSQVRLLSSRTGAQSTSTAAGTPPPHSSSISDSFPVASNFSPVSVSELREPWCTSLTVAREPLSFQLTMSTRTANDMYPCDKISLAAEFIQS